jgi:hypothetical protein
MCDGVIELRSNRVENIFFGEGAAADGVPVERDNYMKIML